MKKSYILLLCVIFYPIFLLSENDTNRTITLKPQHEKQLVFACPIPPKNAPKQTACAK